MKALTLDGYGLGKARVRDVEAPLPAANHILIQVKASSLNDWDLAIIQGKPSVMRLSYGLFKPKVVIPGCDVAGTVVSVGSEVTRFKIGDDVFGDLHACGFGALAEYCVAREQDVVLKPAGLPFVQAAALPHSSTLAWQAIHDDLDRYAGGSMLINGAAGGVGPIALQLAKLRGMTVTGVDRAAKLETLRSLGCDAVVDGESVDFTREGKTYDLILDVQTRRPIHAYNRALRPGGTYVTIGGSLVRLLRIALFGRFYGRSEEKQFRMLALKANQGLDELCPLFESGQVRPTVDGPYPLAEIKNALQRYHESRQVGRIVITFD